MIAECGVCGCIINPTTRTNPHKDWCEERAAWTAPPLPIVHEGHAERLPDTLGDPKNFVLRYADIQGYQQVLVGAKAAIDAELVQVNCTLRALETGKSPTWDQRNPRVYTLASLLEGLVMIGRIKLSIMQWSVAVLRERRTLVRVPKGEQA